jgi:hypothetical protein
MRFHCGKIIIMKCKHCGCKLQAIKCNICNGKDIKNCDYCDHGGRRFACIKCQPKEFIKNDSN